MSFLPARNLAQELAPLLQGLQTAGQAVGTGLQKRGELEQKDTQNLQTLRLMQELNLIDPNINLEEFEGASSEQITKALPSTSGQKTGMTEEEMAELKQILIKDGYPENEAELYVRSKPGVQQAMSRRHEDLKNRGLRKAVELSNLDEIQDKNEDDQAPYDETRRGFKWKPISDPEGATPKEVQEFRKLNQKENNAQLKISRDKSKTLTREFQRLNTISDLNERRNLPDASSAVILDERGNIRPTAQLLGLVNKDTELFVKTLNQFVSNAKDYFGARVTNFDLDIFLKQLPSLLNTEEGRRVIIEQMKLMNQLESLWSEAEVDALQHYGNKADYSQITKNVDEELLDREEAIIAKINRLNEASDKLDIMAQNSEKYEGYDLYFNEQTGAWKAIPANKESSANKNGFVKW